MQNVLLDESEMCWKTEIRFQTVQDFQRTQFYIQNVFSNFKICFNI